MEMGWDHLAQLNPLQFTKVNKRKFNLLLSSRRDESAIQVDRQEMTARKGYLVMPRDEGGGAVSLLRTGDGVQSQGRWTGLVCGLTAWSEFSQPCR